MLIGKDEQNTDASNLAQVLEVIWTTIGECIDNQKSLALYFEGCTVVARAHARTHTHARNQERLVLHFEDCTSKRARVKLVEGCSVRAHRHRDTDTDT